MRNKVIRNACKANSKALVLSQARVVVVVNKWRKQETVANLHKRDQTAKISPCANQQLIQEPSDI